MASNLTKQVRGIVKVVTAVANGDLSQKFVLEAQGRGRRARRDDQQHDRHAAHLRRSGDRRWRARSASRASSAARRNVPGASGVWKDLTDNVNVMASNLTKQVRGIVKVVTAVANGDLNQKFVLEAKGEVAALAETINNMTDTLRTFADQVTTRRARGRHRRQARRPGQGARRAPARGATSPTTSTSSPATSRRRCAPSPRCRPRSPRATSRARSRVEAQGEVAALKDNINQMIGNLKDTTHKNQEQDWLKTNLAKFSGMMQGQRSIASVAQLIMSELTPLVDAQHGAFYMMDAEDASPMLQLIASYGFGGRKSLANALPAQGEPRRPVRVREEAHPAHRRARRTSSTSRRAWARRRRANVVVLPVLFEGEIKAVIELASFQHFSPNYLTFLDQLMDEHRRHPQHDLVEHAHRGAARSSSRRRTPSSRRRPTSSTRRPSCSR